MKSDDTLIDLRALWIVLWLGRWGVVLGIVLGMLVAGYLAFVRITPTYKASAVLVLETQMQKIDGIQEIVSDLPLAGPSRELVLFTEQQVFRSRFLMNNVVKDIDLTTFNEFQPRKVTPSYLDHLFPSRTSKSAAVIPRDPVEFAVDKLLKQVEVDLIPNSFAFKITAHSTDATMAQNIANAVTDQYIQAQVNNKSLANEQATAWLEMRVDQLQRDVIKNEYRVQEFETRIDLISEKEIKVQEAKLKQMRARAQRIGPKDSQSTGIKSKRDVDAVDLFKSSDASQAATRLIEASTSRQTRSPKPAQKMSAAYLALNYEINQLADNIQRQANDQLVLEQVKREADASRNLYEFFLTRLKETKIQKGIQRPDSRILSRAILPQKPSSPSAALYLVLGAVLGAICAVILLFVRHATRRCFYNAMELANATDLPILGVIPAPDKKQKRLHQPEHDGPIGEAVRNLRTRLFAALPPKECSVIMCTASLENEGQSYVTINLAYQLVGLNKKVIVIDCDLRRLASHDVLDAARSFGLSDVLMGQRDLESTIIKSENGFDILRGGYATTNPIDLFAGHAFETLMARLRRRYDVILVETPPILLFSDSGVLGRLCDLALLCVGAGKTPQEDVAQSLDFLKVNGIDVLGLVLGNFDPRKSNQISIQRHQRRYLRSYKRL